MKGEILQLGHFCPQKPSVKLKIFCISSIKFYFAKLELNQVRSYLDHKQDTLQVQLLHTASHSARTPVLWG